MTIHTVMCPPPSGDETRDAERIVFIKEGFCWPALFFSLIWLLWHRMWLVLVGYLAIEAVLLVAGALIGGPAGGVLSALFAVLFALEANALRRWTLERGGWEFAGVVSGANLAECETRFFHHWVEAGAHRAPQPLAPETRRAQAPNEDVLGLFPAPENAR
ncbi:DUF2628 domain-containing protein [Breoghania sp. L-A4]|uniref:DUF2628 domain-containing protein n=1 Tax=Breoghania sp. L-A4 TaxID=2304600 RepID=UPI000E35AC1F|nr:DUF2628 domain-containing protein [Breoghania sp. L-A4]AXS38954.1 DUF2628 domain-containing protein [Breoghania sp. L-A4]